MKKTIISIGKRIFGLILIILPIYAITYVTVTMDVIPVIGSPYVIIILWAIGFYLLLSHPKDSQQPDSL